VGRAADLVLLDWDHVAKPFLDPETPVADAVIQRGKRGGVRTVLCDGVVIYDQGRITQVDQGAALAALHDELQHALSHDEMERRALSRALLPHVRAFYRGYIDTARHDPFYRMSSKT
jgi:cytosine/adenosine deaminase-related metal-dependent hydrolase